jgi:tRNA 2-selenouridine synthase
MRRIDLVSAAELDLFDERIDVRSPAEYVEDHVPGAMSCPVLDDAERARVGTLFKRVSPFDARKAGAALIARNIARHVEERFQDKPKDWRPLVYCWRGGKRSGAMTHVLREVGWAAVQLESGYKAYRRRVLAELDALPVAFRFRVVCGETGSAKSRLLEALAVRGAQVLDLELLACHRGSVLGSLPGDPQPAQKRFESLLWERLRKLDPARPVYVEAESKKIGDLQVPEALIRSMRAAECVRVVAPVAERVRFLLDEYRHFVVDPDALGAQLDCLAGLYGKERIHAWRDQAKRGEFEALVTELLVDHYDPAYRRSSARNFAGLQAAQVLALARLDRDTIAAAAVELVAMAAEPADAT